MDSKRIRSHRELDVYQMAFESAMRIFEVSKSFPGVNKRVPSAHNRTICERLVLEDVLYFYSLCTYIVYTKRIKLICHVSKKRNN